MGRSVTRSDSLCKQTSPCQARVGSRSTTAFPAEGHVVDDTFGDSAHGIPKPAILSGPDLTLSLKIKEINPKADRSREDREVAFGGYHVRHLEAVIPAISPARVGIN